MHTCFLALFKERVLRMACRILGTSDGYDGILRLHMRSIYYWNSKFIMILDFQKKIEVSMMSGTLEGEDHISIDN